MEDIFKQLVRVLAFSDSNQSKIGFIITVFFATALLMALISWLSKGKKGARKGDNELYQMMTRIDVNKLTESIQQEDPETIALMLSYLEPKKGAEIIGMLKGKIQEEVLFHLSELEKEHSHDR